MYSIPSPADFALSLTIFAHAWCIQISIAMLKTSSKIVNKVQVLDTACRSVWVCDDRGNDGLPPEQLVWLPAGEAIASGCWFMSDFHVRTATSSVVRSRTSPAGDACDVPLGLWYYLVSIKEGNNEQR